VTIDPGRVVEIELVSHTRLFLYGLLRFFRKAEGGSNGAVHGGVRKRSDSGAPRTTEKWRGTEGN